MQASVFCGTSLDGYIARLDDDLGFLPEGGEPHGFEEFFDSVDVLVIGRRTFEKILTFDEWPYNDKRVVVLSRQPLDRSRLRGGAVEHMAGEPRAIMAELARSGGQHAYIDGGLTIQGFLRARLIGRLIITRVPVLIGQGIPLFGPLPHDLPLRHIRTQTYASGLVQSEYQIATD